MPPDVKGPGLESKPHCALFPYCSSDKTQLYREAGSRLLAITIRYGCLACISGSILGQINKHDQGNYTLESLNGSQNFSPVSFGRFCRRITGSVKAFVTRKHQP